MNNIEAVWDKSQTENHQGTLNIKIDGYFLNETLEQLYPDEMYGGLIPTLLFKLEKDIVWNRILPFENQTTICPILMRADNDNASYTLIVAEIENLGQSIKWNQIGLDSTKGQEPEVAGSTIDWLDKIAPLEFEIGQYMNMVKEFVSHIKSDKMK